MPDRTTSRTPERARSQARSTIAEAGTLVADHEPRELVAVRAGVVAAILHLQADARARLNLTPRPAFAHHGKTRFTPSYRNARGSEPSRRARPPRGFSRPSRQAALDRPPSPRPTPARRAARTDQGRWRRRRPVGKRRACCVPPLRTPANRLARLLLPPHPSPCEVFTTMTSASSSREREHPSPMARPQRVDSTRFTLQPRLTTQNLIGRDLRRCRDLSSS